MSGGHFQYQQHSIGDIADSIKEIIETNDSKEINRWGEPVGRGYSPEVIARLEEGVRCLEKAFVYAQRADWLFSSDDSEKSFIERLEKELGKL